MPDVERLVFFNRFVELIGGESFRHAPLPGIAHSHHRHTAIWRHLSDDLINEVSRSLTPKQRGIDNDKAAKAGGVTLEYQRVTKARGKLLNFMTIYIMMDSFDIPISNATPDGSLQ